MQRKWVMQMRFGEWATLGTAFWEVEPLETETLLLAPEPLPRDGHVKGDGDRPPFNLAYVLHQASFKTLGGGGPAQPAQRSSPTGCGDLYPP